MVETKVIVVNDDKSRLTSLQDILKKGGMAVSGCKSGFDALEALATGGADLLVVSSELADIAGYQVSCLVKSNERTQLLPVVLVKEESNGTDSFWPGAAMADSLIDWKETKSGDKLVELCQQLVTSARERGWKASMAKESGLSVSAQSGELLDNYRHVVDNLLTERLIGRLTRSMMEATAPRKRFLDHYFSVVNKLFDCQASGFVFTSTANPWASFQVCAPTSKKSLDDLLKKIAAELNSGKDLPLDIRGEVTESGGKALSTPEIMHVKADKATLGALVFCSAQKGFEKSSKMAMAELQLQMAPVLRLLQANQEIEELHQQEQYRASTDPLTGLYNLEFLVGFLQQQLLFSYRQRSPVGLVLIDIDHLQVINDEFGYEIGDLVLSTIANRLLNQTRSSDLLARYGGDEFAVVLPNTDAAGAKVLGEKIRLEVEQMSFVKGPGRKSPRATVSIGCAGFNMEDLNPETILRDAKLALKRAKETGRNKVSL